MDQYKLSVQQTIKDLNSSEKGLSEKEAVIRLEKFGPNKLEKKKGSSPFTIFLSQFKSILVIILIIASAISLYLNEIVDGILIFIIVVLNAAFGFWQEFKAEKAIEALENLTAPQAKVLRDGLIKQINSSNVVPGDIILLEEGDRVPADCRLIESIGLKTDEASLTGESLPIIKTTEPLKECALPDRKNSVYMGTVVVAGRGKAIVADTGMKTEIGKIATEVQQEKQETPLQINLQQLGKQLGIIVIIIASISALASFFVLNIPIFDSFKTGVALAVAAIPEGLPAVATLTLALGIRRLSKKNAIIRRLSSVETLGSCSVICSDKTGTITKNEITAEKVFTSKIQDANKLDLDNHTNLLLKCATLCNDSVKQDDSYFGDPTETALLKLSDPHLNKKDLQKYKRIKEIQFSSERKRMSVVTKIDAALPTIEVYSKGAFEIILGSCSYIYKDGKTIKLTEEDRKKIHEINEQLTNNALRVLGFSFKKIYESDLKNDQKLEQDQIFLGLVGMIDPPREEAKEAIKLCNQAGIRVVMITGDHALTAKAIGNEVGLDGNVITGLEVDKLSEEELEAQAEKINIYARVSPEHKLRILEALKKKGHIVAMTGDGINDAPAIKKADIGIAMGIKGTDVTKEAADMILKDDNFATIVSAVKEGRVIYDNIRNFILYLLSSNVAEVMIIFFAIILSSIFGLQYAIPLTAIQLLWLNLVTDGLPALALGTDPAAENIMSRKPRDPKEKILSRGMVKHIAITSPIITVLVLLSFYLTLSQGLAKAQTIAFTTLVVLELVRAQTVRMGSRLSFFSNRSFILAVLSSFLLQLVVLYIPFIQSAFELTNLVLVDWFYPILFSGMFYVGLWVYSNRKYITKQTRS